MRITYTVMLQEMRLLMSLAAVSQNTPSRTRRLRLLSAREAPAKGRFSPFIAGWPMLPAAGKVAAHVRADPVRVVSRREAAPEWLGMNQAKRRVARGTSADSRAA